MQEIYARLSKDQRILCGRQDTTGRYTCDGQLADYVTYQQPVGRPARYLIPLPGWVLDKKGVWHKTTSIEDRKAHGIPLSRTSSPDKRRYPNLPALARCPKCRAVQWLEPERLKISPGPND